MKAYEYPVRVNSQGELELPDALRKVLPPNQVVRVIILMEELGNAEEQAAWSRMSAEQFLAGYSEADSAYDTI